MLRQALALFILVGATSAVASNYSATPASPASGRLIARDIVWNCGPAACQGTTEESRPIVLCQSLAKRAGRIDSFLVDGRAFSQAELGQCNSAAKSGASSVQAAAAQ